MATPKQAFDKLLSLHGRAVNAHVKWALLPHSSGWGEHQRALNVAEKADQAFVAMLARLFDQSVPE